MKPRRIYIDTSVVGGCLDPEFRDASVRLFDRFRNGSLIAVVSELTSVEVDAAPPGVRALLEGIPIAHREDVLVTDGARELAEKYIGAGVIGGRMLTDARHIAAATLHKVDVLASWNFKHIVNERRVRGYNLVNTRHGHPVLEIQTPAEILAHGE